ncbi:MAG: patatin-like phospholipase family protein [Paludibacter sp.]|nr:patatin-like phospholipase family protein [Paludibacter sp.]
MKKNFLIILLAFLQAIPLNAQKVGLVLSGGGAHGIIHVGVIKALEENNIPIDYVAGTSMGAIVGSLYAMGYSPDEMIELIKSEDFNRWSTGESDPKYTYYYRNADPKPIFADLSFNLKKLDSLSFNPTFLPTNLVSPHQMNFAFVELFSQANAAAKGDFNKLFVPFRCVASDVYNKKAVILKQGSLGDAVRASMTFPLMYKPIMIDNHLLFDGGIFNNFPVDVMKKDFNPGYMIGSAVAKNPPRPEENNIVNQIQNMVVNKSDYSIPEGEGITFNFDASAYPMFDFSKVDELVKIGYEETLRHIDEIKEQVHRKITLEELKQRRDSFKNLFPQLQFRKVYISGVDSLQKIYVENAFHKGNETFTNEDFKEAYFKLVSDAKILEVLPHAIYDDSTGLFDLKLKVKTENQLKLMLGGNISSSTSNEVYIGLSYQNLQEFAQTAYIDGQFGRIYNGMGLGTRIDVPTTKDWYLQTNFVLHRFDYFQGRSYFYDDNRTSFFNQLEFYGKFLVGFPLTMKGRMEFGVGYGNLTDNYHQKTGDNLSRNNYNLGSVFWKTQVCTLNDLMYPTNGYNYLASLQMVGGASAYYPASNSSDEIQKSKDLWVQAKASYDKYFFLKKQIMLGVYAEAAYTNRDFVENYYATIIQAPAFRPTPHSKTIFNPEFCANQYLAVGLKPLYMITNQLHFRTELYWFIPYQPIYQTSSLQAAYRNPLYSTRFMGESTLVFNFKFASAGLFLNHYSGGSSQWNFGLNIGFLLFNKKFLE